MAKFHVEIEATNECNTRCLHCPHDAISRSMGKMDWGTYQMVMDPILTSQPDLSVGYAGMGEPLLNPLIYQFIKYAANQAFTTLTTNGAALTEKNIQRLIDSGLDRLTISFNGETPELYSRMMGGLDFDRGMAHLRRAVEMSHGTRMRILANISVTEQTQMHLTGIKSLLEEAGVEEMFFSQCHRRGGFLKAEGICHTPQAPVDPFRCDIYEDTLFVDCTGRVLSCCHDLAGSNVIGDFHTDSLETILSKKARLADGGIKFDICKACNDLYRFSKDSTSDGRTLSEWIYDLHNQGKTPERAHNALSEWIYTLYQQEDQLHRSFVRLDNKINSLTIKLENQVRVNNELRGEIDAIHASRSWRVMQQLGRLKQTLIPGGSQRERLINRILDLGKSGTPQSHQESKENSG